MPQTGGSMLQLKKSEDRGKGEQGWLKSYFSFSFAEYRDPKAMGFRALRVINEDRIAPSSGFPMHPHRDMEIISYVVSGALEHRDSHGHSGVIKPGEVQRMSAGSGVRHSELNPSPDEEAHLIQIWILPREGGGDFSYAQRNFEAELERGNLVLAVSGNGRDGSISIRQDADLYVARPKAGSEARFPLRPGRYAWLQVVKGRLDVQGHSLAAGDALFGGEEGELLIRATESSEFLLFDLA